MFNPFLITFATPRTLLGIVAITVVAIAVNALIWFGFAFLLAYAATKGVSAA